MLTVSLGSDSARTSKEQPQLLGITSEAHFGVRPHPKNLMKTPEVHGTIRSAKMRPVFVDRLERTHLYPVIQTGAGGLSPIATVAGDSCEDPRRRDNRSESAKRILLYEIGLRVDLAGALFRDHPQIR